MHSVPIKRANDFFAGLPLPTNRADSLVVCRDDVSLYVRHEEWIYRPRQRSSYALGDAVPMQEKPGTILATVGTETWVRCGHFARGHQAQDNARFFMALAEGKS